MKQVQFDMRTTKAFYPQKPQKKNQQKNKKTIAPNTKSSRN